ncbi:RNA recognition motif family protein [Theileria parva strain Muguga]|uniref:Uncharacterized protein n=1 Tax=Theileria parva TaxID=5875 RepID=Q4N1I8_THEPA|nr:RNA recognition motif family protein [Theileria parva strain Muguga]EAN32104.1 RNA recognition motif family protein [Theileria parva strain Muguga]|eukprot:XP_764387.1 hypothetical protein [Theileria parva strain Muguga]
MLSLIAKLKKQKEAEEQKLKDNQETAKIYAQYVKSFDGKGEEQPLKFVKSDVYDPATGTTTSVASTGVNQVFTLGEQAEEENEELSSEYLSQIQGSAPIHRNRTTSKVREIDTFIEEIKEKQRTITERKELQKRFLTATTEYERYEINERLNRIENNLNTGAPDLNTTNIHIGNLSPNVTEDILMSHFSKFGTIVGIRLIPSRTDTPPDNKQTGFVSFMTHEQAENAKVGMDGVEILGFPCKIGWAKNLIKPMISTVPMFAPATPTMPIPQPMPPIIKDQLEVYVPTPQYKKRIIDLTSKYVSESGKDFEEVIMKNEPRNGLFSFVFDRFTPDSVYYRWRVYSLVQGDTMRDWNKNMFKISNFGKSYIPPNQSTTHDTAPAHSLHSSSVIQNGNVILSEEKKNEFDSILRGVTSVRNDICNAMLFVINNSESAYHLTDLLFNYFNDPNTNVQQKISILYVISDVLYNSSSSKQYSWVYRNSIEKHLPQLFHSIKQYKEKSTSKISSQQLIDAVMKLLSIWDSWTVYSQQFLNGLEATLLGDDLDSFKTLPEFEQHKDLLSTNDGVVVDYFDLLATLPLKYRETAYKYLLMRLKELKSMCLQRGLLVQPSDRNSLVIRLIIYDKYLHHKQEMEEKRREIMMEDEENMSEEGSDMEQDDDEAYELEQTRIQEATAQLHYTLMKRAQSPEVVNPPVVEQQSELTEETNDEADAKTEPVQPVEEEDDIDDIFAS